jgi:hypothetical protein
VDLFVDTSVWCLALRRYAVTDAPAVERLRQVLETGEGLPESDRPTTTRPEHV